MARENPQNRWNQNSSIGVLVGRSGKIRVFQIFPIWLALSGHDTSFENVQLQNSSARLTETDRGRLSRDNPNGTWLSTQDDADERSTSHFAKILPS